MNKFSPIAFVALVLAAPAIEAAVAFPQFDIGQFSSYGDAGVSFTDTNADGVADLFTIDATAFTFVLSPGVQQDLVPDTDFTLTASFLPSPDLGANARVNGSGTFSVGTLLTGTFTNLRLVDFSTGFITQFDADLSYTGGSLLGSFTVGRIEGIYSVASGDPSLRVAHTATLGGTKVGPVGLVPVPAAVYLLGSALAGIAGVSRRSRKA